MSHRRPSITRRYVIIFVRYWTPVVRACVIHDARELALRISHGEMQSFFFFFLFPSLHLSPFLFLFRFLLFLGHRLGVIKERIAEVSRE